jgi:hypothetical protein
MNGGWRRVTVARGAKKELSPQCLSEGSREKFPLQRETRAHSPPTTHYLLLPPEEQSWGKASVSIQSSRAVSLPTHAREMAMLGQGYAMLQIHPVKPRNSGSSSPTRSRRRRDKKAWKGIMARLGLTFLFHCQLQFPSETAQLSPLFFLSEGENRGGKSVGGTRAPRPINLPTTLQFLKSRREQSIVLCTLYCGRGIRKVKVLP